MIGSGREPRDWGDEDWLEDKRTDAALDAASDESAERAVKDHYRALGAKTGAGNRKKHLERLKNITEEAALIKARNPRLTKKRVGRLMEQKDRKKFGSANTTRRILGKPPAK